MPGSYAERTRVSRPFVVSPYVLDGVGWLAAQHNGLSRAAIRAELRVQNDRLGNSLADLERQGRLPRRQASGGS